MLAANEVGIGRVTNNYLNHFSMPWLEEGLAIHGFWCNTVTIPFKCKYCGERIFFFSCNCGSRVVFSKLGPPWPKHDCLNSWGGSLKKTIDHEAGKIVVQLSDYTFATRELDSPQHEDEPFDIEKEIVDRALRFDKPSNHVFKRTPRSRTHSVKLVGVAREIRLKVDAFKQLKTDRTPLGSAILGVLRESIWGRLTVHVPDGEGVGSYTAWVKSSLLSNLGVRRGDCVEFHANALAVPKGGSNFEWIVEALCGVEVRDF